MARRSAPFKAKGTKPSATNYTNFRELVFNKFALIREIRGKNGFEKPLFLSRRVIFPTKQSPSCIEEIASGCRPRNDMLNWLYQPFIGNLPIGQIKRLPVGGLDAESLLTGTAPARHNLCDLIMIPLPR